MQSTRLWGSSLPTDVSLQLDAFDLAWHRGSAPQLTDYVPANVSNESRRLLLLELVAVDLEYRWRYPAETVAFGEGIEGSTFLPARPLLEDYLRRFPELSELPAELIAEEYRVRNRWGDRPGADEYLRRFCGKDNDLLPLLASVDRQLKADGHSACTGVSSKLIETSELSFSTSTNRIEPAGTAASDSSSRLQRSDGDKSDRLTPSRVGRYLISEQLGSGAFGVVYRGYDPDLGRQVAVKVSHHQRTNSPEVNERYLSEAISNARARSPGVVEVYDVGVTDDDRRYIISEFVSGGDLAQRMSQERLPLTEAVSLIADVAEALHVAHSHGQVHRDIKPANILLTVDGRPLIADFGLAILEGDFGSGPEFCGTLAYMSPEQASGKAHLVDARSDIYSLGVILFELITGRRPYRSQTAKRLLEEIVEADVRPPRQLNEEVSPELDRICLKALARRPADRYSTAADLAADLTALNIRREDAERIADIPRERPLAARFNLGSLGCNVTITLAALLLVAIGPVLFEYVREVPEMSVGTDIMGPANDRTIPGQKASATRLKGKYRIRVYATGDSSSRSRSGDFDSQQPHILRLEDGNLPLLANDRVQLELEFEEPVYAYVVAIGGDGSAVPLFPFQGEQWNSRTESPRRRHQLPSPTDGWPVTSEPGMQSLVIAASSSPLPESVDLGSIFFGLNPQVPQSPKSLIWFSQGQPILEGDSDRLPRFFDPSLLGDPVMADQYAIAERLRPHFPWVESVSFAVSKSTEGSFRSPTDLSFPESQPSTTSTGEWTNLFNGKDLTGWKTYPHGTGTWHVENGELLNDGRNNLEYLFSERSDFCNFTLKLEARLNALGDSGLAFRAAFQPGFPDCYETQIQETDGFPRTGSLFLASRKENPLNKSFKVNLYTLAQVDEAIVKQDEWFQMEVKAVGNEFVVRVMDAEVARGYDPNSTFKKGHIAIQVHQGTRLAIRRLEIQELPTLPSKQ